MFSWITNNIKLPKPIDFLPDFFNFSQKTDEDLPVESRIIPEMTLKKAINYFIKEYPRDCQFDKYIMAWEFHPQGHLLTQAFADKENHLVTRKNGKPYGRKIVVKKIDEELAEIFQGNHVVAFQR
ncbi:hypothetical protein NIES267_41740 [Calothrix parasitica NIES-267]|uniref:Uncharacterized protein n=1 Tax=Calothrix parasitica NIES-267 TaxID=1973488 RepID=A0A1Z4LUD8_9CYAN|nr:hypothetical protein NIES267_41740 [Calothrix parasitica NIES-267]